MSSTTVTSRDNTYLFLASFIAVFCLLSFGLAAVENPARQARYTPIVIAHGALMTGWFVLLCYQAYIVRQNKLGLHKRLGKLSMILVSAFTVLTVKVAFDFRGGLGNDATFVANMAVLANFLSLYILAIYLAIKKRVQAHKRLMLVASIALILPAFSRFTDAFDLPQQLSIPLYFLFLLVIPTVHDVVRQGKVHIASILAVSYSLLIFVGVVAFAFTTGLL